MYCKVVQIYFKQYAGNLFEVSIIDIDQKNLFRRYSFDLEQCDLWNRAPSVE